MKIIFYKTNSPDNSMTKVLTDGLEIDIFLTSQTNIITPTIPISDFPDIREYNYCHIPELKRYYFIDSVESVNAKIFALSCTCDVLNTYKNDVLNSYARYNRGVKAGDILSESFINNLAADISNIDIVGDVETENTLILTTVGVN